jgi:hypothetical protein
MSENDRTATELATLDDVLFAPSTTAPRRAVMTEPQKALIRANATLRMRTVLYKRYLDKLELRQKLRE